MNRPVDDGGMGELILSIHAFTTAKFSFSNKSILLFNVYDENSSQTSVQALNDVRLENGP